MKHTPGPSELLDALIAMTGACAAAMCVINNLEADEMFIAELRRAGIADGFGARAQALIARVSGVTAVEK